MESCPERTEYPTAVHQSMYIQTSRYTQDVQIITVASLPRKCFVQISLCFRNQYVSILNHFSKFSLIFIQFYLSTSVFFYQSSICYRFPFMCPLITCSDQPSRLPLSLLLSFQKSPPLDPIPKQLNPFAQLIPISLRPTLLLFSQLRLGLPCGLLHSGLSTKTLQISITSPKRDVCSAHLIILDLITLKIFCEECSL
jgi:hypothetical protein